MNPLPDMQLHLYQSWRRVGTDLVIICSSVQSDCNVNWGGGREALNSYIIQTWLSTQFLSCGCLSSSAHPFGLQEVVLFKNFLTGRFSLRTDHFVEMGPMRLSAGCKNCLCPRIVLGTAQGGTGPALKGFPPIWTGQKVRGSTGEMWSTWSLMTTQWQEQVSVQCTDHKPALPLCWCRVGEMKGAMRVPGPGMFFLNPEDVWRGALCMRQHQCSVSLHSVSKSLVRGSVSDQQGSRIPREEGKWKWTSMRMPFAKHGALCTGGTEPCS